ncbi:Major facilitator superfamily (MFS) profile domain-containing protein [Caenorhabditis elegans]|uniref:Major facilitator superfamily (MFS) profile domain-containing protein n=2 Tax=Caenorhabditis elegans TaxID=6239 RepID=Q21385_CAEEL|nr:Major facilitator superfamily (MFS) profile domain-containing protein [Caenorhabditis elegans]CCD69250.1 Major facilitator superfamily (MFS) profile domain-containing protein [Caenorhabditis elegans]|eukprot:NP_001041269.2 Uncharacterized protein CELE_K09C4.1 [Caenorhabditis elegans]
MKFTVPRNILFMIFTFVLLDIVMQMQVLTFSALAELVNQMNNYTLSAHFGITPTETSVGVLNSIFAVTHETGNALAIIFLLPVADSRGRKFMAVYLRFALLFLTGFFHLLATSFQAAEAYTLGQLFLGIQSPLHLLITPMYILECAPDNCRGFASTALIFSFSIGKLLMFSAASPTFLGTIDSWFIIPLFEMVCSVMILCLMIHLPDSPKWLIQQNKVKKAEDSIKFYYGKHCHLDEVVTSLIKEKNLTKDNRISLRQIWENDTLRESLKILFAVTVFLQFDTTTAQSVYTIDFHKTAGFTVQEALNINLILTTVLFPTKFIGTLFLDALGRRPAMGVAGVMKYSKSMLLLAFEILVFISGSSLITKIMYVAVELLTILVPVTGANSIRVLFVTELFPPSARTAVGQAMLFGSMAVNSPIVALYPIVNSIFPPIFFVPFVISQMIFGIYLYRHMPETRGRAVYDIIESLDRNVASRTASVTDENTPLFKDQTENRDGKWNSLLNTPRTRALTFEENSHSPN